ncbi:uncharacterized protein LOC135203593 isoform X2 [Macrobrachium nipponense]|uniref:uncharacterized protein LOC135203593 isoform X2 n=1 Tax=Macrobrachium nipponense TaxID=159736 RepID=UPI0030C86BE4
MGKNKRKMKEANGEDALSKRPRIKPEGEQAVSETLPVVRKDDKIRNGKPTLTKKGKWGKRKDTQNADENEKVSNEPALKKLKVENENVNDIKNKLGTNDEEPQSSADAAIPKKKKKKKKKKKQGRIIEASEGKEKTDKKVSDEPTLKKLKVENGNSSNEVLEVKKLEVNDKQQQLNADMATGKKKKKKGKKKQASISEANEVQKETKELGSPGSSVKEQGKKNKKKKNKKNKVEMGKMNQTITDIAKPSSGEMKSSNNAVVEQKNKKKVPKAEEASSATGKSQSKKNGSLDGSSKDSSNEAMISSPLKLNEAYGDEASRDEIIKCWSEGSPLQKDNGFKLLTEPFKCMYMPHFLQDGNFLQNVKEELSSLELHKKSNDLYKATNCQEAGCNAVLQDPCGHEVCRTHAPCAISHEDLTVWHHEACTICYDLVSQFLDGAAAVKEVALATLKAWVGGFGKNAPKGQPYILDKKLAVQIFPGGKATGYVDPAAAAPTIAYIQQQVEQALVGEGSQDVVADVATLDLNLEPMTATNCQEAGCNAIFQDPCGHEVCRTHAPCAISHEDLTVWHHEACTICYDLVSQFLDGAATVKEVALATLKAWVGGFGKNAPKGQPYILDKKLAVQIFPGGKATGYVDPAAAAPIIAYIQQQVEQALVGEGSQDIVADVATLDLNLEPMTFKQTSDLKSVSSPCIESLRKFFYGDFRKWLSDVTGIELNDTVDMSSSRYEYTDVLLCHDDELKGRRVAYILYLTPPWYEKDGGTLDLFDVDNKGQPRDVVASLLPKWNTLAFFEVSPVSFHQVREVLSRNKVRLSINGWFHGPSVKWDPKHIEPPRQFLSPVHLEEEELYAWINPTYLDADTQRQIRKKFQSDSEIELESFICEEKYEDLMKAMQSSMKWIGTGPANKQSCKVLKQEKLPAVVADCMKFLKSEALFLILSQLTGLKLHQLAPPDSDPDSDEEEEESKDSSPGMIIDIRQWSHGCYTLLRDCDQAERSSALDASLFVRVSNKWALEHGGFTSYIAKDEDEELLTVVPRSNCLALVYRDTETLKFTKYINASVKDLGNKDSVFYEFSCTYRE